MYLVGPRGFRNRYITNPKVVYGLLKSSWLFNFMDLLINCFLSVTVRIGVAYSHNNELKYLKTAEWGLYLSCIVHGYNTISMIFWAIVSLLGGLCFQSVFLHEALLKNRNSLHAHRLGTCVLQPNSSLPFHILRIHLFLGKYPSLLCSQRVHILVTYV